jgi:hypothetical protein
MIQLVRRASLLAAFSLIASAATAYAECAWVLWENDRKPHPYTSDLVVPHYRPISPSPNWTTATSCTPTK